MIVAADYRSMVQILVRCRLQVSFKDLKDFFELVPVGSSAFRREESSSESRGSLLCGRTAVSKSLDCKVVVAILDFFTPSDCKLSHMVLDSCT